MKLQVIIVSFSEILSHPDTPLENHLEESLRITRDLIENKSPGPLIHDISELIAIGHDFGKGTDYFQEYIRDSSASEGRKKNHSFFSSLFVYHIVKEHLEDVKYDLSSDEKKIYPLLAWYVVYNHHGNLDNSAAGRKKLKDKITRKKDLLIDQAKNIRKNEKKMKKIYKSLGFDVDIETFLDDITDDDSEIISQLEKNAYELDLKEQLSYFLDTLFLFSILQEADKYSAIRGVDIPKRKNLPSYDIVDRYINEDINPDKSKINKLRSKASNCILNNAKKTDLDEERMMSITLPTGLGKTLASYRTALFLREKIQQERGFKPRIIYALPYTSIIEQNYDEAEKVLKKDLGNVPSDVLLKHHHLSKGFGEEDNPVKRLLLTEDWYSEFVVTTFVQLFESIFTKRKNRLRKFHNIANSIVIIDEPQAIPRKYWSTIQDVLQELSDRYNVWFLIMTATQPHIFQETNMIELVPEPESYYGSLSRIKVHDRRKEIKKIDELVDEIEDVVRESEKDVMAVMNTISSVGDVYDKLKNEVASDVDIIYLSTNLTPKDRRKRITEDIQESSSQKIVVTTQLIEAGVDIDMDVVYRDFAPHSSIVQTGGRCNRENDSGSGELHIIQLEDSERDADTPQYFSGYIYDDVLLGCTRKTLSAGYTYDEKEITYEGTDSYFRYLKRRGADDEDIYRSVEKRIFSKVDDFTLIEKDYVSLSIYIEQDESDKELRKEFEKILNENQGYEKKGKILSIRRDFYEKIVNVRADEDVLEKVSALEKIADIDDLRVVPKKTASKWYDKKRGFTLPDSTLGERMV